MFPQVTFNDFRQSNYSGPIDTQRPPTRVASVQIIVSLILGFSAFMLFSILRLRYPKIYVANFNHLNSNYVHSSSRQNLPKLPSRSLFGWIPILLRINEQQVLDHAGLDAVVFLGFFKMCIKLLAVCAIFAITVISPIRYKFTGKLDQDDPDDDLDASVGIFKKKKQRYELFLWSYTVFTYVFTFIGSYFLFKQTVKIIDMRQKYLGKQKSITDRTIKLSGIPPMLRDEEDLKRHVESLNIGEVDSIVIVKEWNDLNKLFQLRKKILRKAEVYWVAYFEANGIKNKNDILCSNLHPNLGDLFNMNSTTAYHDREEESNFPEESSAVATEETIGATESRRSSIIEQITDHIEQENIDESTGQLPLLDDELHSRPKIRNGLFGLFGPRLDAINYCTQQLEVIDKEIARARQRDYPATSTAFITMKSVSQAQMVAQAVLDPKINHLITNLAPAPHDIIWDHLCLTRRERNLRIFFVTLFIGIFSLILVIPVRYLAQFLSLKSISKVWPSLGKFLESNRLAATLVTTLLPTYLFTILNIIMPYFYIWISSIQGYTSHSDEELSTVSKNFFYIFVNLFLVFTMAGTASLSDTTEIAYQLAQSLRKLSLFYVDLIILQGLGIFPYKLLSLGNLFKFSVGALFWCKTPRDYLNLYKPPVFNFGLQLPQPILILIITIVYSVMSTKILTAGLVYFIIGYFVYKYQLLYACVHPPHSTGKVWPLVFRRIILGLLIFQLTMAGTLALQKAYICASFLAPLPILTLACLWNFQTNYIPLSIFIALRSIDNNEVSSQDEDNGETTSASSQNVEPNFKTLDERRELNKTYEYPHLIDNLDGPLIAIDGTEILLVNNDGMTVRKAKDFEEWD